VADTQGPRTVVTVDDDMPAGPAGEDRSRWRLEEGGQPYVVAQAFVDWARGDVGGLEDGANITTSITWPTWRAMAITGELKDALRQVNHWSTTVRYPADDMAYVIAPILHPDQDETVYFNEPMQMLMNTFTLILDGGTWRVHCVGAPLSPADFGSEPYSW
jgi:hypothetical protein